MPSHHRLLSALAVPMVAAAAAASTAGATTQPPGSDAHDANALAPRPLEERATVRVLMSGRIEAFLQILVTELLGELDLENIELDIEFVPANEVQCSWRVDLWPDYSTSAVLFGPSLIEERRDVGLAFTRAVARTVRDHLQHDCRDDADLAAEIADLLEVPLDAFLAQQTPDWVVAPSAQLLTETQDYCGPLPGFDTALLSVQRLVEQARAHNRFPWCTRATRIDPTAPTLRPLIGSDSLRTVAS